MMENHTNTSIDISFRDNIKKIYVYFDGEAIKIEAPTSPELHSPEHVKYVTTPPIHFKMTVFIIATSVAHFTNFINFGMLRGVFLISVALLLLYILRRKEKVLARRLKQEFPEHRVVHMIRVNSKRSNG